MFLKAQLLYDTEEPVLPVRSRDREMEQLVGTTVAPLQRHVVSVEQGGVPISKGTFVFPDLSIRQEGMYKLLYLLYVREEDDIICRGSLLSETFQVYSAKEFPGMGLATDTTEELKNGGLKVRVTKSMRMTKRTTARFRQGVIVYLS